MTNQNEIQKRKIAEPVTAPSLNNIWTDQNAFQTAMRMANALSASTIVPRDYQGEKGLGNCMIALEMASRLNTSPLMVMQNLYVVNGRPSWSSQYIIAMINNSKKYRTELQFEFEGEGDTLACTAYVEDYSGRTIKGPKITMDMAKKEGWVNKNGSKWQTMPEVMIRYRAASFFGRLNCPDMIMGLYSTEEASEIAPDFIVVDDVADRVEKEIIENANKEVLDPTPVEESNDQRPENVNEDGEIQGEGVAESQTSESEEQQPLDLGEDDPY